ncbi:MAG TPA: twin-arginine translocation signal domain-containing protein, partial [Paraburkholderia sp.]
MHTTVGKLKRRDFLRLAALGGAAFASALPGFTYG